MFGLYRFAAHSTLRASGARSFRFSGGDSELICWELGPPGGEPWLFLHGLGAIAAGWLPLGRALKRECRIVIPEMSMLGGSRIPDGGLAVGDGVPLLSELIERSFPGQRVTVAGNSLGGWQALRLALAHPGQVARLVLIAPGGFREQDWGRIEQLVRVRDLEGARRVVEAMFLHPPLPRPLMARAFRAAFTSQAVLGPLDKLSEPDAIGAEELAGLEVPVALIWGERDGVFDVGTAETMAGLLPRARLYRLSAAHVVQWDRPSQLVGAVADFRARTGPTAPDDDTRSAA